MNIKGKTIVLTGAKRIGKTVAIELAKRGANLAIIYNSSKAEAQETVEAVRGTQVTAEIFQANLSVEADIKRVASEVVEKFKNLAGLVHMAAPYPSKKLGEITMEDFEKTFHSIVASSIFLGQELGEKMDDGRIVLFSDWAVTRSPYKDYLVYNAAKSAVEGVMRSLARELAPKVLVNAIAPGPILAPADLTTEENSEALSRTPLQKWGGAEEIAKAVLYLFDSDFTTGVVLPVDGGRSIS